jgi:3-methylcrotonyl-CoA carboxylase alpha subunit
MFTKILVANRGEIACRVMRTARRMGIRTVAVYSEADAHALHVATADEAYCVGPPPAKESYLRGDAILAVAGKSGAQAIHPGYGFLSENAAFAAACEKAGVVFIGPPAAAIRAMGSKSAAKTIMQKAKVPLVPGYHGEKQDPAYLQAQADKIGYPLLIKASAGGGGKGMRIVENTGDFAAALASCKREAASAFDDDRVLLERYLRRPRHIEIQVFADRHGNCVHLFKAIGYVGAGTVEFIADPSGAFHFMEMNTRLQVEHPVTEMITGQDLVEWQIRVATGERLPLAQDALAIEGHALEARIYAEDPDRDFLPATGTIEHLARPATGRHVRIDTGVRAGDAISPHYDPMIAKLIVWGPDRANALARMRAALEEFEVVGLTTNVAFLARLVASEAFAGADLDTGWIERHRATLFPPARPASDEVLALATLDELLRLESAARDHAAASADPYSPWGDCDGWRLNEDNHHVFVFREGERQSAVTVHYRKGVFEFELPHGRRNVAGERSGETLRAWLDDRSLAARVVRTGRSIDVFQGTERHTLELHDPGLHELEAGGAGGGLAAPMPGKIIAVLVEAGAEVEKGTPLLILEAMKMEHTIKAPAGGTVKELLYGVGDQVEEGAELLAFERSTE